MSILDAFRGLGKDMNETDPYSDANRYTDRASQATVAAIALSQLIAAACIATTSGGGGEPKIPDEPKSRAPIPALVQPSPASGSGGPYPAVGPPNDSRFSEFYPDEVCTSVKKAVDMPFPVCLVGDAAASAALDSDCPLRDDEARDAKLEAVRIAFECRDSSDGTERAEVECADAVDVLILESAETGDCSKIDKLKDKVVRAWRACLNAAKLRGLKEFALRRFFSLGNLHWLPHWGPQPDVFDPDKRVRRDSDIPDCLIDGLEGEFEFYRRI